MYKSGKSFYVHIFWSANLFQEKSDKEKKGMGESFILWLTTSMAAIDGFGLNGSPTRVSWAETLGSSVAFAGIIVEMWIRNRVIETWTGTLIPDAIIETLASSHTVIISVWWMHPKPSQITYFSKCIHYRHLFIRPWNRIVQVLILTNSNIVSFNQHFPTSHHLLFPASSNHYSILNF